MITKEYGSRTGFNRRHVPYQYQYGTVVRNFWSQSSEDLDEKGRRLIDGIREKELSKEK